MKEKSVINKILFYIEENLNEDLNLDKIANEFNYSKFYIERVFTKKMNCTLYKYIQRRRLTEAARKLVETDKAIIEIAYEAQYNSQQAFTLAFNQLYLCTPFTYRKNGIFSPKQSKVLLKTNVAYRYNIKNRREGVYAA